MRFGLGKEGESRFLPDDNAKEATANYHKGKRVE
jgi:hypothetical protein